MADQVAALKALLRPKLMSLALVADPVSVDRWIADEARPRLEQQQRIRTAFQIVELLKPVEADPTIRAWFMGANPQLGDRSSAESIAESELGAVLAAARAFRVGG